MRIWDRDVDLECPSGGAVLEVRWAVDDQSYDEWFSTVEAANASLEAIAAAHGRRVDRSTRGYSVDLTASGCIPSSARVVPND
jgi:hypothetical protein